jgi:hypothetical protein
MCTAPFLTQRFCTDFHQSGLVNEKCTSFFCLAVFIELLCQRRRLKVYEFFVGWQIHNKAGGFTPPALTT